MNPLVLHSPEAVIPHGLISLVQRVAHFQEAAKGVSAVFGKAEMQALIQRLGYQSLSVKEIIKRYVSYLSRHIDEIEQLQRERRPGRPSSTREDLLKHATAAEEKEYASGFWLPEMQDEKNLEILRAWSGEWSSLNTLRYIRLSKDGTIRQSSYPPKGLS